MNGKILNLLDVERHGTRTLGPGLRYAIWTQGCPFDCPGCITPEGRPVVPAKLIDTKVLANDIIANRKVTGITISGGEPFLQSASIACLLGKVKASRPELDVIIFTGFNKEDLLSSEASAVLELTDLLIDGRYVKNKNDGKGLRGSSNQNMHFLTDKLLPFKEELLSGKRRIEITLINNRADAIGIPLKQTVL